MSDALTKAQFIMQDLIKVLQHRYGDTSSAILIETTDSAATIRVRIPYPDGISQLNGKGRG